MSNLYVLAGQSNAAGQSATVLTQSLLQHDGDARLVEFFKGGTSLDANREPGVQDWYPFQDADPATGELYDGLIDIVDAEVVTHTPKGMIWIQGESDSKTAASDRYEANLREFVTSITARYGPDFKIVVVQLSAFAPAYDIRLQKWATVQEAQARIADDYANVTLLSTTDLALEHGFDYTDALPESFRDVDHYTYDFNTLISQHAARAVTGSTGAITQRNVILAPGDPGYGDDTTVVGNDDDNFIRTGTGDDIVRSGEGNDRIVSGGGGDRLFAGIGDDTVVAGAGADIVNGGADDDVVFGGAGDDVIFGDTGHDVLDAQYGDDIVDAGAGDDTVFVDEGSDTLDGGVGSDTIDYSRLTGTGIDIDLLTGVVLGNAFASGDAITGFENVTGSDHADILKASHGANTLDGGDGDDALFGRGGDDLLSGGLGADTLDGGTGRDTLSYADADDAGVSVDLRTGAVSGTAHATGDTITGFEDVIGTRFDDTIIGSDGANRLDGGKGDDTLRGEDGDDIVYGGAGADTMDGGTGRDRLDYQYATDAGVAINLSAGTASGSVAATGDTFTGFEDATGTAFGDTITGSTLDNRLYGLDGDDALAGSAGNDFLYGGRGADTLDGGAGRDKLVYSDATDSGVTVDMQAGTATGSDVAVGDSFSNVEDIIATDFGDFLTGDTGINRLWGRDGDDTLHGGGGNDLLLGEDGNDTLAGGAGADVIDGGAGRDTLSYHDALDGGIVLNLTSGTVGGSAITTGDTFTGIEDATGTGFADTIFGSSGNNRLRGGAGDDSLSGRGGIDLIYGDLGADNLDGGNGQDWLVYGDATDMGITVDMRTGTATGSAIAAGDTFTGFEVLSATDFADTLTGSRDDDRILGRDGDDLIDAGAGNDHVYGGLGADSLDGGAGRDKLVYSDAGDQGIVIDLGAGSVSGSVVAAGDSFTGFEDLIATDFIDTIAGTGAGDRLWGRGGDDVIRAGAGNDYVAGELGNDSIAGGVGADSLDGGGGTADTLVYDDATDTGVTVDLSNGTASGSIVAIGDAFTGFESVYGTDFDDNLTGDAGRNRLWGADGDDTLIGGAGNDGLRGGAGSDDIWGGAGGDNFIFDADTPPSGADIDTIHDFVIADDGISFAGFAVDFDRSDLTFSDAGGGVRITAAQLGTLEIILDGIALGDADLIFIAF